MAGMGAPDGFIDVVAAITPPPDDDTATPPHWNVTFGVDDADATAAKARELGATVLAGPFDAPWTRMAVIQDPQGATFIASQFVMENKDLVMEP
jgi:predicted enzyme related to lactoylglutathione lyase